MKAAVVEKYGPPEVVRLLEVEKPVPDEKEVRVKIYATTVNRTDCGLRMAVPYITRLFTGLLRPKHKILGSEFTGVVDAVGKNVKSFNSGDKVFGLSTVKYGAHAEYLCIDEDESISGLPENLTLDNALAICEGTWYAWNNLKEVDLKKGDKILINGGSGSIGSAAVQLSKYFGLEVTAVTETKNVELVRNLGAEYVIDYTKEDFTKLAEKFDYVFDAVGKSRYSRCKKLLKPNGVFFSTELGPYAENIFLVLWTSFFGKRKVLFPIPVNKKENILFFKEFAEKGHLEPVIDRTYPFEQIVDAYKYVESGQKVGSVVIQMNNK
ncbi:MAG: NAD(P)-dependent alcohol dehydrogenase [Balneolaceae bacterium]